MREKRIKAEERLMEIFMETELSHSVTGSDLRIVAKAILEEFIHLDELPKEREWYLGRSQRMKEIDDSFNQCLARIKKLRGN